MALTKTTATIWDTTTLTANAADTVSSYVDLTDAYSAVVCLKLTNGATGPTVASAVGIQVGVDEDNDDDADAAYNYGGLLSPGVGNAEVRSWVVEIPPAAEWVRTYAGRNTDQDVVVEAWVVKTTAL